MTYKTKIGIAVGVGFAFIIIMAIVMSVFVKNNDDGQANVNKSNSNSTSTNSSDNSTNSVNGNGNNSENSIALEDVYGVSIRNKDGTEKIVKISDDFEVEEIGEVKKGFLDWDYYDGKVYVAYSENQANGLKIYSIDLETNEEELVLSDDDGYWTSLKICDGNFYYITLKNAIAKYNIETETKEDFVKTENNETITNIEIDKTNKVLYYMKNSALNSATSTYIYKCNLNDGSQETLVDSESQGKEIVLYENCLVCSLLIQTGGDFYSVNYVYNTGDGALWDLGRVKMANYEITASEMIAFMKDYIALSEGDKIKITDYEGNTINEALYEVASNEEILDVVAITPTKLQVEVNSNGSQIYKVIDFETSTIDDTSEYFYNVLRTEE